MLLTPLSLAALALNKAPFLVRPRSRAVWVEVVPRTHPLTPSPRLVPIRASTTAPNLSSSAPRRRLLSDR